MSRKGENIYKRKDGRWEGRYKKGIAGNGKTIYGSCYGKTYRETKEKLELYRQNPSLRITKKNSCQKFRQILRRVAFGEEKQGKGIHLCQVHHRD